MECVLGRLSKGNLESWKSAQDLRLDKQNPQCLFLP